MIKINKRTKKLLVVVSWIPFAILLVYIFYLDQDKKNAMSHETLITIGQIVKYEEVPRAPSRFIYRYNVSGVNYEAGFLLTGKLTHFSEDSLNKYIGKKFKLKYNIHKPKYSELLIDKPVE